METLIQRFLRHIALWRKENKLWNAFYFVLTEAASYSSQYRQKKGYCILGDWSCPSISMPKARVLILDGNSEIGLHVILSQCYLICLRHLIGLKAATNRIFFPLKRPIFLPACATCSELPSNISTLGNRVSIPDSWTRWKGRRGHSCRPGRSTYSWGSPRGSRTRPPEAQTCSLVYTVRPSGLVQIS